MYVSQSPDTRRLPAADWVRPERAWRARRPLLPHRTLAALVLTAVGGGAVALVGFWWLRHPAPSAVPLADRFSRVAQVSGLLGTYLLLVEIVLVGRFRILERRLGSWLAGCHRRLGGWLILVIGVHVVCVVAAHSARSHTSASRVFIELQRTDPGVLSASLGFLALLAAGFVSIRALRRRLGYEGWHAIHLIMYPAAAATFYHQIALGVHFLHNMAARIVWTLMHTAVAAAVVGNRVLVPLRDNHRHKFRVTRVERTGTDTLSVYVGGRGMSELDVRPGNYFRWRFLAKGLWQQAHPFSLSAAPNGKTLRLTVKCVGSYTRRLRRRLRPGVRVMLEGPYGAFTDELRRRPKVVLIGGGIGVTPLRAIAETMYGGAGDIVLIQRASTPDDLVLTAELTGLHRAGRIRYIPAVGRRGADDPLAPRLLWNLIPDLEEREVFICASAGLTASVVRALRRVGVPRGRIHIELFDF